MYLLCILGDNGISNRLFNGTSDSSITYYISISYTGCHAVWGQPLGAEKWCNNNIILPYYFLVQEMVFVLDRLRYFFHILVIT